MAADLQARGGVFDGEGQPPKYRLLQRLGEGAMGSVYEAEHRQLGVRVAVKTLHPHLARDDRFVDRLIREARAAARIRSPHVVEVTDVERTDEGARIVMERVAGLPLDAWLEQRGRPTTTEAIRLMRQLLDGVASAHAAGVVHRDLKPSNVMITEGADGRSMVKILDFGVAKLQDTENRGLTDPGTIIGTPEYMAPEQAREGESDARSDVFALGVLFYELLSGVHPARDVERVRVPFVLGAGAYEPLEAVAPEVPEPVAATIHQAMAGERERRFASAQAFRCALDNALSRVAEEAGRADTVPVSPAAPAAVAGTEPAGGAPSYFASAPPLAADVRSTPARRRNGRIALASVAAVVVVVLAALGVDALWTSPPERAVRVSRFTDALPPLPIPTATDRPPAEPEMLPPERWPKGAARIEGTEGAHRLAIVYGRGRDAAGRIPIRLEVDERVGGTHRDRVIERAKLDFEYYGTHRGPRWRLPDPQASPTFMMSLPQDGKYHVRVRLRTARGEAMELTCDICVDGGWRRCPSMRWSCEPRH